MKLKLELDIYEDNRKKIMQTLTHDPTEYIRGLQQLLVSDKKRIAFLFGAGTSLSKKNAKSNNVPSIGEMTDRIISELSIDNMKYADALGDFKTEINSKDGVFTIETLLSLLEMKILVIGCGELNGLRLTDLINLRDRVKKSIREIVCIHKIIENDLSNVIHVDFAEWIKKSDRKFPIEIFTTNYDYLFEIGLEAKNVPFYDGFTGTYKPFFDGDSVEDFNHLSRQTKLWKIHGSLGWHYNQDTHKVWRRDSDSDDFLIYPSSLKYDQSRKQPYLALSDRLSKFLKQPDSILITCGYSFGDAHINERILNSLNQNGSSHVFALFYDLYYEQGERRYSLSENSSIAKLAKEQTKLSIFGKKFAVIGGKYGQWKLKREPDKEDTININEFFDEDAPISADNKTGEEILGKELWTGEGELTIPDFALFVRFLQSMMPKGNIVKEFLNDRY